jgi:hypothetical protein
MLDKYKFKKLEKGKYELHNFVLNVEGLEESYSSPQTIQFMEASRRYNGMISGVTDGILVEQLLIVGFDRLKDLNNELSDVHIQKAASLVKQAISLLLLRAHTEQKKQQAL